MVYLFPPAALEEKLLTKLQKGKNDDTNIG